MPTFNKPFSGDFPVANFSDHNVPKEFVDANGTFVTFWGEQLPAAAAGLLDGHEGYDFLMPIGTPLLAVAAGTVVRVTDAVMFFCPPLNRTVDQQKSVLLEHILADGRRVRSAYTHMDRIDVTAGTVVAPGQQIGVSGNTGCSGTPHLHFVAFLVTPTRQIVIDPYGWSGTGSDPWELHAEGAASIQLWNPGQTPRLERQRNFDLAAVAPFAPAFITKVVYQGIRDDTNPNNEYVELTLDQRMAASAASNGYGLRFEKAAFTYSLPAGMTLTPQNPTLRIYVGTGSSGGHTIYMGLTAGILSNLRDDCIRVLYPNGSEFSFNLGGCP